MSDSMFYFWGAIVAAMVLFLTFLNTPKGKGWLGETKVKWIIGKTKVGERYVINNLVIVTEEGKTCQIDHVLINTKGVFVIETKNYSGRIYGKENHLEWTQVLNYGRVKNKLYNPIKQNRTHIYHISRTLTKKVPINSAVVFVQGNTQYIESDGVFTLSELKSFITSGEETLSLEMMQNVYAELSASNKTVSNEEHVNNIREMKAQLANNICPRCGAELKLRNGSNGQFYGCSNYPKCRFTKNK